MAHVSNCRVWLFQFALSDLAQGENMLVNGPEECIDCGACVVECHQKLFATDAEPGAVIPGI